MTSSGYSLASISLVQWQQKQPGVKPLARQPVKLILIRQRCDKLPYFYWTLPALIVLFSNSFGRA